MKISRSSWHYKLHKFVRSPIPNRAEGLRDIFRLSTRNDPRLPKSLCGYFWLTLLMTVIYVPLVILFAVGLAVFGIGFCFYWLFVRPLSERHDRKRRERLDEQERKEREIWDRHRRGEINYSQAWRLIRELRGELSAGKKKQKQPGLVRQYIRAGKDQVCPLIEVVDD